MNRSLKALVIGADALEYSVIEKNIEKLPNIRRMMNSGAYARYDAYVQKGYKESYVSEMNWASIYTGLEPWRHKVKIVSDKGERRTPYMNSFDGIEPFWKVLNENGYTVGLWAADCCIDPLGIDGYVVSAKYHMLEDSRENRLSTRELQVNKGNYRICGIDNNPPARLYPKTLKQQGESFGNLQRDPQYAMEAIKRYHFQDSLQNFQAELDYFFTGMEQTQRENGVDMLFFYTPTTDLIAHSCMFEDDTDVLVEAYSILDRKLGELVKSLNPQNVVLMSDHGMMNFKDVVKTNDEDIKMEAFSDRDKVIWLPNGYMAFEAHNGALLFTAHAMKGFFLASGNAFEHKTISGMRTIDIYPILLELFGCRVPDGRLGMVPDIFKKNGLLNQERKFIEHKKDKVALIAAHEPAIVDIVTNELYVHYRDIEITVIAEDRYEEIYRNNPRVRAFAEYSSFSPDQYDVILSTLFNRNTNKIGVITIKGELK